MAGWNEHRGQGVHLPLDNVDTDQLIPARFMSAPRSEGYGDFLLHDLRRDDAGDQRPDFPLNARPDASVLIAGRNFGSGSSREAAVYALVDAGFRAVIASSFGDIFAQNAVNNGLLAAKVAPKEIDRLTGALSEGDIRIDLDACRIAVGDVTVPFDLDDTWRTKLMKGWDDIDLTLEHAGKIAAFRKARPDWAWPAG